MKDREAYVVMRNHRLPQRPRRRVAELHPTARLFELLPKRPNDLWQMDATYIHIAVHCWWYAVIDYYSRYLLACYLTHSYRTAEVSHAFGLARQEAKRIPRPLVRRPFLVTENGPSFLARRFRYLVRQRYSHVRIQYRTPHQLGLLERFHQTVKTDEVYWRLYGNPEHARASLAPTPTDDQPSDESLTLSWAEILLTIRGGHVPGGAVKVWYMEAFCRPGSTNRDWKETVIPHTTKLIEVSPDGRHLAIRSTLEDGVIVDHEIRAGRDEVDIRLTVTNPSTKASYAQWAQPCVRVDAFTGVKPERNSKVYLPKCFVFCRRPPDQAADAALGHHGALHARPGVVPGTHRSQRRQPSPPEPADPLQRPDRLLLGGRKDDPDDGVGALPGAIPGCDRVPALRLPNRRGGTRPNEANPGQTLSGRR